MKELSTRIKSILVVNGKSKSKEKVFKFKSECDDEKKRDDWLHELETMTETLKVRSTSSYNLRLWINWDIAT